MRSPRSSARMLASRSEWPTSKLDAVAEFFELTAAALTQFGGETIPLDITAPGSGHFGFARHVPYGVVAAITPFNAPINLLVQKIAPAIGAGNALGNHGRTVSVG
jgi:acyl-CoA reductase-like NAD-dependent aldehyde dehydrogenase